MPPYLSPSHECVTHMIGFDSLEAFADSFRIHSVSKS
jgi:hypothetical protein